MRIQKTRSILYGVAKFLGDIQALMSPKKGAVQARIRRRILGKIFGRMMK